MEREFNKTKLFKIIRELTQRGNQIQYYGDLSDLGNEIGYIIGRQYENMTDEDIDMFITGFKHGVSLTNGKH